MKKKLTIVYVCVIVMLLAGGVGAFVSLQSQPANGDLIIVSVNHFDENLLVKSLGRHNLSADDYVDVSLTWNGGGRVIFLSSTSGLSENNVIELIESGIFPEVAEISGILTAGAVRVINGEETMLEFASSNREINWRPSPAYGYRYFYVITNESPHVWSINGNIAFERYGA